MSGRPQNQHLRPAQPGEVRNPAGRPKGSRNKLGEDFIQALQADFQEHGRDVIARVREEKPADYMKVVASLLPKEFNLNASVLTDLTDDELAEFLAAIRSAKAGGDRAAADGGTEEKTRH